MRATGTCYVLTAFDLGFEIDLVKAEARLSAERSDTFKHKRGSPAEPRSARLPLRFTRPMEPIALGTHQSSERLEVAVYGFGSLCLTYTLPVDLSLAQLVHTSTALYDNAALLGDARARAREVLAALGDSVREPHLADAVEDYVIYSLQPLDGLADIAALEREHGELLARILRAEEAPLSNHEIANALEGRISYRRDELVLVDWFGSLLLGADMDDERRVLELATVELVELRFLDERLEQRIDEAYDLLASSQSPFFGLAPRSREIERLARFQADSAILHESSDNALKLLGDDYLARLYEVCSDRFHFAAWDTAIERKLETLESIYTKISDQSARRRSELLEWIIILLFVLDILLYFLPWGRH